MEIRYLCEATKIPGFMPKSAYFGRLAGTFGRQLINTRLTGFGRNGGAQLWQSLQHGLAARLDRTLAGTKVRTRNSR